jgi:hypothetical protein
MFGFLLLGALRGSGETSRGTRSIGGCREKCLATVAELWRWWRVTRRLPELRAGSGELGAVWREYDRGRAALIGAGVVHGRAWTSAGTREGVARRGRAGRHAPACQPRSSTWHIAYAPVPTPIGSKSS